jgi:hypothetical protein
MSKLEMEKLQKELEDLKADGTELDEYNRGVYETLCWLLDGAPLPDTEQ